MDKNLIDVMHEMKNWEDFVIRIFDKGSGFFLMDKKEYTEQTEKELGDPLMHDHQGAIQQCSSAIVTWTVKWSKEPGLTDKSKKLVIPSAEASFGNNYMNIKDHKPEKNYPGRLISTGMNTPTKNLAILTAFELKKLN